MAEDIHPGSFVGDTVEEFKKLPTWGKIAVGVGVLVVIYLGYTAYKNNKGATSQASTLPPTSAPTGNQSPFPSIQSGDTSVPLLPAGVNPLYNSQGGLTGFQQAPPSQPTPVPGFINQPGNPPPPTNPFSSFFGLLGQNVAVNFKNRTYQNAQGQSVPIPLPTSDKLVQGSQNRVWYTDAGGQHLLTSGTGPAIDPRTNTPAPPVTTPTGAGGMSVQSAARSPIRYTPRYGDNMNEVAAKLGLIGGWRAFNVDSFEHGKSIEVPR